MPEKKTPSIRKPDLYDELRDEGMSKEKAARISNAAARDGKAPFVKGGKQPPYEEWTKEALYDRARELEVEGRSDMTKADLIEALRTR